jgi:hypothetical protein
MAALEQDQLLWHQLTEKQTADFNILLAAAAADALLVPKAQVA